MTHQVSKDQSPPAPSGITGEKEDLLTAAKMMRDILYQLPVNFTRPKLTLADFTRWDKAIEAAHNQTLGIKEANPATAPGGQKWLPIESAPINTSVLVFIPRAGHYGPGVYRALRPNFGVLRGWQVSGLSMGRDCGPDQQPTHWMPLPSVPECNDEQLVAPISPTSSPSPVSEVKTEKNLELPEAVSESVEATRQMERQRDSVRLDFLDECNRRLNQKCGTVYGWEMILSHNVTRLMLESPYVAEFAGADLNDSAVGKQTCREAIDAAMQRIQGNVTFVSDGGSHTASRVSSPESSSLPESSVSEAKGREG